MFKDVMGVSARVRHRHWVSWGPHSLLTFSLLTSVVLLSVGCDRFPWESKPEAPRQGATDQPGGHTAPQAAGGSPVASQDQVATVNQASLSTTDVELATLELKRFVEASQRSWQPLQAEDLPNALDLHDILNEVVDSELKAQDALARGLTHRPEVQRRLTYLQRGFYAQEWDRWQRERAMPTEEEVQQFYEQNKAGFVDPERIRARQIVTQTLAEAETVRAQAVQGGVFAQLAQERSVGARKEQGGDIGWHLRAIEQERLRLMGGAPTEEIFFPQLESVVFSMEVNQVSQPVKGPDGRYYIVLLEERKPSRQQTELEMHDAIKQLLTLQKIQRQLEQLHKQAKIEQFPEHLKDVQQ